MKNGMLPGFPKISTTRLTGGLLMAYKAIVLA